MEDGSPDVVADRIVSKTIPLGQRFYPSESAFPLRKQFSWPVTNHSLFTVLRACGLVTRTICFGEQNGRASWLGTSYFDSMWRPLRRDLGHLSRDVRVTGAGPIL
jgi:hypothetical protein